jgi:type IV secretion system protein TrbI
MDDMYTSKKKQNPDEVKETSLKNNVGKLNKNAVIYVLLGIGVVILFGITFKPHKGGEEKNDSAITAANVPDFQTEIEKERAKKIIQPAKIKSTAGDISPAPPKMRQYPLQKNDTVKIPTTKEIPKTVSAIKLPEIDQDSLEVSATDAAARKSSLSATTAPGVKSDSLGAVIKNGSFYGEQAVNTFGIPGQQGQTTPAENYKEWNDQIGKKEFSGKSSGTLVARPPSMPGNTIFAGTTIPAVLITGINTDLPGDILATVTENIYDTVSGKNILIPQNSKLLARYNSGVSWGQSRVQVVWQRIIRPDGVSIDLGAMNGVDSKGYAGYQGGVDQHLLSVGAGIGLMALTTIVTGQLDYSAKKITPAGSEILNDASDEVSKVGSKYVDKTMDVQPTLSVQQGTKILIFVNSDLIFPAIADDGEARKYSLEKTP